MVQDTGSCRELMQQVWRALCLAEFEAHHAHRAAVSLIAQDVTVKSVGSLETGCHMPIASSIKNPISCSFELGSQAPGVLPSGTQRSPARPWHASPMMQSCAAASCKRNKDSGCNQRRVGGREDECQTISTTSTSLSLARSLQGYRERLVVVSNDFYQAHQCQNDSCGGSIVISGMTIYETSYDATAASATGLADCYSTTRCTLPRSSAAGVHKAQKINAC